jgi:hypothetical protein
VPVPEKPVPVPVCVPVPEYPCQKHNCHRGYSTQRRREAENGEKNKIVRTKNNNRIKRIRRIARIVIMLM